MYSMKDKGKFTGKGKKVSNEEILFDLLLKIEDMGYKGFWIVAQEEDSLVVVGHDPIDLFTTLTETIIDAKESSGSKN